MIVTAECHAQDVADAAKQERARKEAQQKKSKHVYTEEDLKRAQILTPEDRAQLEARKNQATPPAGEQAQQAADGSAVARDADASAITSEKVDGSAVSIDFNAQPLPPDAPLGDVARRFREQKQSQKLERSADFHLPFVEAPVLASPKPPVQPLRSPLPILKLAPPRLAPAPYQPPVKHSPFARPRTFLLAPRRLSPSPSENPSRPLAAPAAPSLPPAVRVAPVAPLSRVAPPASAKLNTVTVKPGDSLWKLAEQNLGKGLRWHDLVAVNPGILDPNHIVAGSQIYLPAAASSLRTATKITAQKGDTLSQIAQSQLGHASYAACIAHTNPAIRDANRIFAGQSILLPATCKP